jgi:hypothetical protein
MDENSILTGSESNRLGDLSLEKTRFKVPVKQGGDKRHVLRQGRAIDGISSIFGDSAFTLAGCRYAWTCTLDNAPTDADTFVLVVSW